MPMSSDSRRRKAKALIVLAVIPIRPRETIYVCEGFHSFSLEFLPETLQPWSQSKIEHCRLHGVSLLDTAGARDRSGFPRVHPKEHVRWPCTVAPGHKRRERWHIIGYLHKHRRPFHSVKGVGTVTDSEPIACRV